MKKTIHKISVLCACLSLFSACDLDVFPETSLSEPLFWKSESDFKNAANQLYSLLGHRFGDTRADDLYRNAVPDDISSGTWIVPATSADWTNPYKSIFAANRIIENAPAEESATGEINRFVAEARFFRAYNYHLLVCKYGDVPYMDHTAGDIDDPVLYLPRTPRAEITRKIYADLEWAAKYLPKPSKLDAKQYGRVTWSAAKALKARVALYEGTRAKFHGYGTPEEDLKIAYETAWEIMETKEHTLYKKGSTPYKDLFVYEGEGAGNTENIFVKVYGFPDNLLVTHNYAYQYFANFGVTRNFLNLYLTDEGLPYQDNPANEVTYNDYMDARDPRLVQTMARRGELFYHNYNFTPYEQSKTGFGTHKFVIRTGEQDQPSTLDCPLIRYAEVLLIYAEAKFEHDGSISDDDLELTVNQLRGRVGFGVKLTNDFVTEHQLDMRTEIRRERSVELALEGFRYDDLIRWKTAEEVLPQELYGAKFIQGEWGSKTEETLDENLSPDKLIIVQQKSGRFFNPERDYLYPIPTNDIAQSKQVIVQNPNWK